MKTFKTALLTLAVALGGASASASVCDISDLPCWDGGKCNIKFKNHTGKASGSGNSQIAQISSAMTIRVTARKENGDKKGNALSITAGASKTMNLEKKTNFSKIKVTAGIAGIHPAVMHCRAIRSVLKGNGTCNIMNGTSPETGSTLGYSCANNTVIGTY